MSASSRIVRHRLIDRLFHWLTAASVLTLLGTGFLPILGVRFAWVTPHWIAGVVLAALVLLHVVRALLFQDWRSMWIGTADVRDAIARARWLGGGPPPPKPGKYMLAQKLFHHTIAVVLLATIVTGLLMMVRIDTPFWTRNPYWLADQTWGVIYVIHGVASLATITLIMLHVYFALRPEKLWITRSMILGWIDRRRWLEHHDAARWPAAEAAGTRERGSMQKGDVTS